MTFYHRETLRATGLVFGGKVIGTIAIAAALLGRSYIGIESLFQYVEEARKNIGELRIDSQQTEA